MAPATRRARGGHNDAEVPRGPVRMASRVPVSVIHRTRGTQAMNVIMIVTDQHKAATIGAYGDPLEATPNLDRLAAMGTIFTRCRTQNPFCQPARATMLTGT